MVGATGLSHNPFFRIENPLFKFTDIDRRTRIGKLEMTLGKFPSGTCLKVILERCRLFFGIKRNGCLYALRFEF